MPLALASSEGLGGWFRSEEKMARDELKKWRCGNCSNVSLEPQLLRAPNPFDDSDNLTGCPNCMAAFGEDLHELCDEPQCLAEAGCGWPTGDRNDAYGGYRRTCGRHSDWASSKTTG